MKKLLIITALAATLALTACGPDTGKPPSGPPALIQPTQTAPATEIRFLAEYGDDSKMYEVTGTNSSGMRFRCYATDGYSSVSQTCFEYGPAS